MQTLYANISDEQSSALEEVIEKNPGWNKTLVTRALIAHFLSLAPDEQEKFVKTYSVKKRAKRRKE